MSLPDRSVDHFHNVREMGSACHYNTTADELCRLSSLHVLPLFGESPTCFASLIEIHLSSAVVMRCLILLLLFPRHRLLSRGCLPT